MTFALGRIAKAVRRLGIVRAVYRYGVRTFGRRFTRFAFGSAMALAASEITLLTCLGIGHLWPTVSAFMAWVAGAATSYVLSRWAWERRGRPHLLKETLPFWLIAVGTIVVLSSATSLAHHLALSLGLRPIPRLAFTGSAYFLANVVTFLSRFMIFHYVLFADRGSRDSARSATGAAPVEGPAGSVDVDPRGPSAACAAAGAAGPSTAPPPRRSLPPGEAIRRLPAGGGLRTPSAEDVFSGAPGDAEFGTPSAAAGLPRPSADDGFREASPAL